MKNLVFKIKNEKVSKLLQRLLLDFGYWWPYRGKKIQHTDKKYLFLYRFRITSPYELAYGDCEEYFNKHLSEDEYLNIDLTLLEILADKEIEVDEKKYIRQDDDFSFECKTPKVSELLQKLLFANGYEWGSLNTCILHLEEKYLFLDKDILCHCSNDKEYFYNKLNTHKKIDLTLLEILTDSCEEKKECKFKVGQVWECRNECIDIIKDIKRECHYPILGFNNSYTLEGLDNEDGIGPPDLVKLLGEI